MSSAPVNCPRCGTALPPSAPEGLCPRCLGALNFATETVWPGEEKLSAQSPLTPEQLAVHFPQLEIIECLGRGGMGVVYKARQKSLNRMVALKLLAPERVQDAKFAERFTQEAQALAKLSHPNIVTIHDFGEAGGFYFLLMEFVDGVNLRQLLRSRKLSPEEALAIVPPLCDALQYAHERGIVHRDIKPENLLLNKEGRVKIADFGIAKILGAPVGRDSVEHHLERSEVSAASISGAGPDAHSVHAGSAGKQGSTESHPTGEALSAASTAGTPGYMAPEQSSAPQKVDARADIYSLGVVFYEMLTGELPGAKLQPPSRKVLIDVRLDEIVLRALEVKPELRYQTAGEMRTQVETVVSTPGGGPASEQLGRSSTLTPVTHLGARGNSPLQWNGWSFLGATVGLSIWMPATAILSDWNGTGFALSGATTLTVWVAALVLWNLRDRISAFSGFMWLLAVGCVSSASFLFGADWLDLPVRSNWPTAAVMSPLHYVWMLGLFPVMAVWIWIRHRSEMPPANSRLRFGWLRALALVGVGMLVLFAVLIAISIGRANRAKELAQGARAVEEMAGLAMFSPMVGEGIGTNEFRSVTTITKLRHVGVWTFEAETAQGRGEVPELGFWAVALDERAPLPVLAHWTANTRADGLTSFDLSVEAHGNRFVEQHRPVDWLNDFSWQAAPQDRSYWVGPGEWHLNDTNQVAIFEGVKRNDPNSRATIRLKFSLFALPAGFVPAQRGVVIHTGQNWRPSLGLNENFPSAMAPSPLSQLRVLSVDARPDGSSTVTYAVPTKLAMGVSWFRILAVLIFIGVVGGGVLLLLLLLFRKRSSTATKVLAVLGIVALLLFLLVAGLFFGYWKVRREVGNSAATADRQAATTELQKRERQAAAGDFPTGAHIGRGGHSVLVTHGGADLHYVFYYAGDFGSSSSGSQNAKTRSWVDKGSVKLKNGRTFGYRRQALYPDELTVNGARYDLQKGSVFVLRDDGTAEQLKLSPPLTVARDPEALAKLLAGQPASIPGHIQFKVQRVENPPGTRTLLVHFERDANPGLGLEAWQAVRGDRMPAFPVDVLQRTQWVGPRDTRTLNWTLPTPFTADDARRAAARLEKDLFAQRDAYKKLFADSALILGEVRHPDGWSFQLLLRVKREQVAP